MSRKYNKKIGPAHTIAALQRAVQAVKEKKTPFQRAAENYGIPRATLFDQVKKACVSTMPKGVEHWSVFTPRAKVSPESCYYHRCLGCYPDQTVYAGSPTECHPSNWVTAQWVHNIGHPPPNTDSRVPIEYRCLKMIATPDDKSFGNTMDVIRGCVPRAQVDSVCLGLVAVERARGHSDARCFICNGNNCNKAARTHLTALTLGSLLLYFVLR